VERIVNLLPRACVVTGGPSTAGRTTLSKIIIEELKKRGLNAKRLDMGSFFKGKRLDFGLPDALDWRLINACIKDLLRGKAVGVPHFDMEKRRRTEKVTVLKLEEKEILLIEGAYALDERLLSGVSEKQKFSIYVEAVFELKLKKNLFLTTSDLGLLRRIVRDARFRNIEAIKTLREWPLIIDREEKYVLPTKKRADLIINTALFYELPLLKAYAIPYLEFALKQAQVEKDQKIINQINRLYKLLEYIPSIGEIDIPEDSILIEFIGGEEEKVTTYIKELEHPFWEVRSSAVMRLTRLGMKKNKDKNA